MIGLDENETMVPVVVNETEKKIENFCFQLTEEEYASLMVKYMMHSVCW